MNKDGDLQTKFELDNGDVAIIIRENNKIETYIPHNKNGKNTESIYFLSMVSLFLTNKDKDFYELINKKIIEYKEKESIKLSN